MRHRLPLLLWLAACSRPAPEAAPPPAAPTAPPTAPPVWRVSADAIGPIALGIPLATLNQRLHDSLRTTVEPGGHCAYVRPAAAPSGVSFMVLGDTVARVDIDTAGVLTVEGRGVGDTETQVLETYRGRVQVQPHKYSGPTGHYLVVTTPTDTMRRIVFETDGTHVLNYRAGLRPAVDFVEGCS